MATLVTAIPGSGYFAVAGTDAAGSPVVWTFATW